MTQIKRETAIICSVKDLLEGSFVRTEGWAPSYFATEAGNISRVNLMGVIVEKGSEGIIIDDGSGKILLKSFENNTNEAELGEIVQIIGRPRIFNEKKYVVPEIMKKTGPRWAEYRKLQLERIPRTITILKKTETKENLIKPPQGQNPYQRIVEFIKDLDNGEGADAAEIEKRSGLANAGELINRLIEEGEIFEIKPGKIKILE